MHSLSLLKRQCGECSACCTAVGVEELGKPSNFMCEHRTCGGCGIYGKHPPSCQTYKCIWLEGALDYDERPDQLGAVFHLHEEAGEVWLDCHVLPLGEKQVQKVRKAALKLLTIAPHAIRGVRIISAYQIMNVGYPIDLKKYPGGEPDGENGTSWKSYDEVFYVLDAPARIKL